MTREEYNHYKLSKPVLGALGSAFFGTNILAAMVACFITYYYTDSVGIAAGTVGTMILISKVLDGISDFIMAIIIEKTNTRWGKAYPWFIIGMIPMAITLVAMFAVPVNLSYTGKVIWMYVSYILCNVVAYTAVLLSLSTMTVLMTGDAGERGRAGAWGNSLGAISIIIVSSVTEGFASQMGWFRISLIYAIIAMAAMLITALLCREKRHLVVDDEEKDLVKVDMKDLKLLVKNKYFWSLLAYTFLRFVVTGSVNGVGLYYFIYIHNNAAMFGVMTLLTNVPGLVLNFVYAELARKYGYRRILSFGCMSAVLGFAMIGFAPNLPVVLLGALIVGLGNGTQSMVFPFMGDVVDYGEMKYGKALTGFTNSGYTIGIKIGSGLGGAVIGWILQGTGYVANAATQSAAASAGIIFAFAGVALIANALCLIVCHFAKVQEVLVEMRAAAEA